MTTGVQFEGKLDSGQTKTWKTWDWNPALHVYWYLMPTSVDTVPEVKWSVAVARTSATLCDYHITITNLSTNPITFEARFAIL